MLNNKKYLKERVLKSLNDNYYIDQLLLDSIKKQLKRCNDDIYYKNNIITNNKRIITGYEMVKDNHNYFSIVIDHDKDFISCCQFFNGIMIYYVSQEGLHSNERTVTERYYIGPFPSDDMERRSSRLKTRIKKFNENGYLAYDSNSEHYDKNALDNRIDTITTVENWYYGLEAANKSSKENNVYREIILTKTTELLSSESKVQYGIGEKETSDSNRHGYNYHQVSQTEFNEFQRLHGIPEEELKTKQQVRKLALS